MDSLFTNLILKPLLKQAVTRDYVKGQTLLYPGETINEVFVIKKGAVLMHDVDEHEHKKILHIFGPATLFPMTSFSASTVAVSWYYTALTPLSVYVLSYEDFKSQLESEGCTAGYNLILRQLLEEVHELLFRLSSMNKTDSRQKVIGVLRFLTQYHAQNKPAKDWRRISLPISHQLLADMTGLTRETVTITLKLLQEEGLVRSPALTKLEVNTSNLNEIA